MQSSILQNRGRGGGLLLNGAVHYAHLYSDANHLNAISNIAMAHRRPVLLVSIKLKLENLRYCNNLFSSRNLSREDSLVKVPPTVSSVSHSVISTLFVRIQSKLLSN